MSDTEQKLRQAAEQFGLPCEEYAGSRRTPIILLTGFEPFGEFHINPSQQIAEALNGETIGGARVVGLTLPVVFGEDTQRVFAAVAEHRPALVMSLGLHAGQAVLDVERFAVNLRQTETPGREDTIVSDGFAALFATIDAERVAQAVQGSGYPARAHSYAGAYLCNHIFYQALHYAQQWDLSYRTGFIHLPLSAEQLADEQKEHLPALPLETMIAGTHTALEAALETDFYGH